MSLAKRTYENLKYELTKTWRPIHYQGSHQKAPYFEGWYFKQVSLDGEHIWSIIPGISITKANKHSFIQFINGKTAETWYVEFPLESFSYSRSNFQIAIGPNRFSLKGIELEIQEQSIQAQGAIQFANPIKLETTLLNPGIMGWYSFVPFMECYHGLVSADHDLSGSLLINGRDSDFTDGKGYSEKDWGRSMPSSWVWMQSNHFDAPGTSMMLSIARIPWLRSSFTGFLCILLLDGKLHRFATYTGATIKHMQVSDEVVNLEISDKHYHLIISARHAGRGILVAPVNGAMDRRIAESVDAVIEIAVKDSKGRDVFLGTGINAGLELVGEKNELTA